MLSAALRYNGYEVIAVADGAAALDVAATERPDAVVLDVMLPDIDGFEVCRQLRTRGDEVPVVFLTAVDSPAEKVRGLTIGGDDYLAKPFSLEELVARIGAVLRRADPQRSASRLECGPLSLDADLHEVRIDGQPVALAPTEFNLLRFLLAHQGQIVSKPQILDHVWDYDFGGNVGIVETYIGYLRRKVDHGDQKLIHTVRGVGYVLRCPSETPS